MSKSILTIGHECFFCRTNLLLERHHVFEGTANRKKSEEDGCWVYLCADHHRLAPCAVHRNTANNIKLKQIMQKAWEETYGDREAFIKRYGRSYL